MKEVDVEDAQEYLDDMTADIEQEFERLNIELSKYDGSISSMVIDKLKLVDDDIQHSIDEAATTISAEMNKQEIDEFQLSAMKKRAADVEDCLNLIKHSTVVAKLVSEMLEYSLRAQDHVDVEQTRKQREQKETSIAHASYSFCQSAEKLEAALIEYENQLSENKNDNQVCDNDEEEMGDKSQNVASKIADKGLTHNALAALYSLIATEREMVGITLLSWLTQAITFENNGTSAIFSFDATLFNREAASARLSSLLLLGDYEHRFAGLIRNLQTMLRYCLDECDVLFEDKPSSNSLNCKTLSVSKRDGSYSTIDRLRNVLFVSGKFNEIVGQIKVLQLNHQYSTFARILGDHAQESPSPILQSLAQPDNNAELPSYEQSIRIVCAIETWWRKIGLIKSDEENSLPELNELTTIICNSQCTAYIARARALITQNITDLIEVSETTKAERNKRIQIKKETNQKQSSDSNQRLREIFVKTTPDTDAELMEILNLFENSQDYNAKEEKLTDDRNHISILDTISRCPSTKLDESVDETKNQSTMGLVDTMAPPIWTTPSCRISASMARYAQLLEECMIRASEATDVGHAGKYYETARHMLELYAILATRSAGDNAASVPIIAATLYNNHHYLAHAAAILGAFYAAKIFRLTGSTSFLSLVDFIPKLRSLGDAALQNHMDDSKATLRQILDNRELYSDLGASNKLQLLIEAVKQSQIIVAQRINALQEVLSTTALEVCRRSLARHLLDLLVVNVVGLEDIPADDANRLADILSQALIDVKKKCFKDPIGAQIELQISANRITELCLILRGSLVDISDRWCNAKGPLADTFSRNDVESLVRALFQNSKQRSDLIKELRAK